MEEEKSYKSWTVSDKLREDELAGNPVPAKEEPG
jgi:hypothetical protein